MAAGKQNLEHVLADACKDRDCELHHPEMQDDPQSAATGVAMFMAGARAMGDLLSDSLHNVEVDIALGAALAELREQHEVHRMLKLAEMDQ